MSVPSPLLDLSHLLSLPFAVIALAAGLCAGQNAASRTHRHKISLILLTGLTLLLAGCGSSSPDTGSASGNGTGSATLPQPIVPYTDINHLNQYPGVMMVNDGPAVDGGDYFGLKVTIAPPAGFEWHIGGPDYTPSSAQFIDKSRADSGLEPYKLKVVHAITGTYTMDGGIGLRRLADNAFFIYTAPVFITLTGGPVTNCPVYTVAIGRAPTANERKVLDLINAARVKGVGCVGYLDPTPAAPPLIWDDGLAKVSRQMSIDMATRSYFSHYSPEHIGVDDIAAILGVPMQDGLGDNIGNGFMLTPSDDPTSLVNPWLASPGQCHQMLRSDAVYADVGIDVTTGLTGVKSTLVVSNRRITVP